MHACGLPSDDVQPAAVGNNSGRMCGKKVVVASLIILSCTCRSSCSLHVLVVHSVVNVGTSKKDERVTIAVETSWEYDKAAVKHG